MDELRTWYRESIAGRIEALEGLQKALSEKSPEAAESIRRIAHSLRGSGATYGFPKITGAAVALEEAPEEEFSDRFEKLLETLRKIVSDAAPGEIGVLVVDDDPEITFLLRKILASENREIFTAETAARAEEILAKNRVSLIILDLVLPDTDGRNLLVRLKERPGTAGVPIILLSAKNSPQIKAECFALGADIYFEKPFDPATLVAAVSTKIQQTAETMHRLLHDAETGLPNRAAFFEALKREKAMAARDQIPLSLALADLDRFRLLTETHGQAIGAEALRHAASVVSKHLHSNDLLARWGGGTLAVLLPGSDPSRAALSLEKSLAALKTTPFASAEGAPIPLTFSAGVSKVLESAPAEETIAEAERLLYFAKVAGRARVYSSGGKIPRLQKMIFLAEDDETLAALILRRLEAEGFKVVRFSDGAEALAAAPELSPALVLLDIKMPGLDGFELLQALRRLPAYSRIPVAILTVMGGDADINRGFELGADDYILKPFSPEELISRIHRLLTKL